MFRTRFSAAILALVLGIPFEFVCLTIYTAASSMARGLPALTTCYNLLGGGHLPCTFSDFISGEIVPFIGLNFVFFGLPLIVSAAALYIVIRMIFRTK